MSNSQDTIDLHTLNQLKNKLVEATLEFHGAVRKLSGDRLHVADISVETLVHSSCDSSTGRRIKSVDGSMIVHVAVVLQGTGVEIHL